MASVLRRGGAWLALIVLLLGGLAGTPLAQESFRVTHSVDRSNPGRTKMSGLVFNDGRTDVLDVWVTAEALDANGKVVARGVTFVSPMIRQGTSANFEAAIPAPPTATTFRARVSNFRAGLGSAEAP
jgi:hypothetical protein